MKMHYGISALLILGICGGLLATPATNAQALRVRGTRVTLHVKHRTKTSHHHRTKRPARTHHVKHRR
ncbi:hypothetical protein [Lactiplantibacillus paraplantarum]|uniref:Extracellular protein n=1 Tax=Lactiplantibacillus paraplantarum TaxID=60520 RepID=A0AAD0X7J2_9LACO|nr:hypothetical protein [Lactiplantibacillus paraplantarum]AVW09950.1 hypothetical protein DA077_05055 [Lactiplantibacillus paraplantarum]AYJ38211.1 hypothetical protein LP667_04935 [Lactiplantibacillus paraplantarum]MCU4683178.1 hypothetical protein [Lactiplantibacillus paraplantarum]MDL2062204.1 hypothetical protein [Lactiplantibacillus paraplantarum]QJU49908.1 hypothetical protein CK401_00752 [Lactiplantibacillus paraplantarum]